MVTNGVLRVLPRLFCRLAEAGQLPRFEEAIADPARLVEARTMAEDLMWMLDGRYARRAEPEWKAVNGSVDALRGAWPSSLGGTGRPLLPDTPQGGYGDFFSDRLTCLWLGEVVGMSDASRPLEDLFFLPHAASQVFMYVPRHEREDPTDTLLARRLLGSPAFLELLRKRDVRPEEVCLITVEKKFALAASKTCYSLCISTIRPGKTRILRMAMRVIPLRHRQGLNATLELERSTLRELTGSRAASYLPRHWGSAVIPMWSNPSLYYLVFFDEWVEGEDLVASSYLRPSDSDATTKAALEVLQSYVDAVECDPQFLAIDPLPHNVLLTSPEQGARRVFFFDCWASLMHEPYDIVKALYYGYLRCDHLPIPPEDFLTVFYRSPVFRPGLDQRIDLFEMGGIVTQMFGYWSRDMEEAECEMLRHLSQLRHKLRS